MFLSTILLQKVHCRVIEFSSIRWATSRPDIKYKIYANVKYITDTGCLKKMRSFSKAYKFVVKDALRLQFTIQTLIWLKMTSAKWCLHILICFLIVTSQTKSNEYQNKRANDMKLIFNKLHNFILQQDGAKCHTSGYTLSFIRAHVVEPQETTFWSPHNSHLNPLVYCVWNKPGIIEHHLWV